MFPYDVDCFCVSFKCKDLVVASNLRNDVLLGHLNMEMGISF